MTKLTLKRQLVSPKGYPNKVFSWKRGEAFKPEKILFQSQPLGLWAWGSHIEMQGLPKDTVLLFGESMKWTEPIYYIGIKNTDGDYTKSKIDLPKDVEGLNLLAMSDKKIRLYFRTKTKWLKYDERDIITADVEILANRKIKLSKAKSIFRLAEEKGYITSVSVIENEEFDPADDKIIVGVDHNVSDSALLLSQTKNNQWESSELKDPLNLKYKSMSVWEDESDKSLHLSVSGFLTPRREYILTSDKKGFNYELIESDKAYFDSSPYKVEQLWVDRGKDQNGKHIKVPYYIIYNPKLIQLEKNKKPAPTLIYAYGGFEISMKPRYSGNSGNTWLGKGGVYVLANIRGGNEFGPYWHQSAIKKNRTNTYGDFFAISEDLIRRGITSSDKLAINGGSNGGLLTGVAFTQRPELYKAIITAVPLLDMMR